METCNKCGLIQKQPPDPAKIKRLVKTSISRANVLPGFAENIRRNDPKDIKDIKQIKDTVKQIVRDLQEAMKEADRIARNPELVR